MTWVKLDDRTATHPKHLAGGLASFGLWCAGLCYCNAHHNGGVIPKAVLRALFPSDAVNMRRLRAAADELVVTGRWHDDGESWSVHGYSTEQAAAMPDAAKAQREADAERQRRYRVETSQEPRRDLVEPRSVRVETSQEPRSAKLEQCGSNDSAAVGQMSQRDAATRTSLPARPGPTKEEEDNSAPPTASPDVGRSQSEQTQTAKRPQPTNKNQIGTRLPADWTPPAGIYAWARTTDAVRLDREQVDQTLAEFRDYWPSVPGPRGRKLDWLATFRNRLREVRRRHPRLPEPGPEVHGPPPALPPPHPDVLRRAAELDAMAARGEALPVLGDLLARIGRPAWAEEAAPE